MKTKKEMNKLTHVMEYTPNLTEPPFLVRLVGLDAGVIDKKNGQETKDILGSGKTFIKAARAALKKKAVLEKERAEKLKQKYLT